jgi:hypothetical protein
MAVRVAATPLPRPCRDRLRDVRGKFVALEADVAGAFASLDKGVTDEDRLRALQGEMGVRGPVAGRGTRGGTAGTEGDA